MRLAGQRWSRRMVFAGVASLLVGCGRGDMSQVPELTEDPLGARDLLGLDLLSSNEVGYREGPGLKPQYATVWREFSLGDRDPKATFDEVVALAREAGWEGGEPSYRSDDGEYIWHASKAVEREGTVTVRTHPFPLLSVTLRVEIHPF